jgi:hypothetical protein
VLNGHAVYVLFDLLRLDGESLLDRYCNRCRERACGTTLRVLLPLVRSGRQISDDAGDRSARKAGALGRPFRARRAEDIADVLVAE